MKYVFTITIFCLSSVYLFCQTCFITGETKNFQNNFIRIEKPINGFFNNASFDSSDTAFLADNKFSAKIKCSHPVFITIFFSDHPVRLIVKPNDTIKLAIDFKDTDDKERINCEFFGNNAEGQKLFYFYNYQPVDKFLPVWDILRSSAESEFVNDVRQEIEKQVLPFKELYSSGNIDKEFYKLVSTTITSLLLFESVRKVIDPNIKDIHFSTSARKLIANKLFEVLSPFDDEINYGLYANNYLKLFYKFQKAINIKSNNVYILPDTVIRQQNKRFTIDGNFCAFFYEKRPSIREYLLGSEILNFLHAGLAEILESEIEYFKIAYPSSRYSYALSKYKKIADEKKDLPKRQRLLRLYPYQLSIRSGWCRI